MKVVLNTLNDLDAFVVFGMTLADKGSLCITATSGFPEYKRWD